MCLIYDGIEVKCSFRCLEAYYDQGSELTHDLESKGCYFEPHRRLSYCFESLEPGPLLSSESTQEDPSQFD